MKLRRLIIFLAGLITFSICSLAVIFILPQVIPMFSSWGSEKQPPVRLYVQVQPVVEVGKEFKLVVTVQNDSMEFLQIDEILLAKDLLDAATVMAVFPGSLMQQDHEDYNGYQIGYLIPPQGRQEFEFTLLSVTRADRVGNVRVVFGENSLESGIRLIFQDAVAAAPTAVPTFTPMPTPTLEPTPQPTVLPTLQAELPYNAVVRVTARFRPEGQLVDGWIGSGVFISPNGLILTNAHIVAPTKWVEGDYYIIGITSNPDEDPEDTYYAEPLQVDENLDIAVLQIVTDMSKRRIDRSTLNLPFIHLGDSDSLELGDPLTILGYPFIGGDTITLTKGDVAGFTSSRKYGARAFIKTEAIISGGASGGAALDANGLLVAIPTQLGPGGGDVYVDCRVIADTDGDGDVDSRDSCVPVGGFINALRPIKLALPLIEAAGGLFQPTPQPGSEQPSPGRLGR